jgi:hypothetical protein
MSITTKINTVTIKNTSAGANSTNVSIEDTLSTSMYSENANWYPNILGPNSKVSAVSSDTDQCSDECGPNKCCMNLNSVINDDIEVVKESDKLYITFSYKDVVGSPDKTSTKIQQPAWLILYTNIGGSNYTYSPSDWTSSITDGSGSAKIDVTPLFDNHTPIFITVVNNYSYKINGIPDKLIGTNGQKPNATTGVLDTTKLNSDLYYESAELANGAGSTASGNLGLYYLVETDNGELIKQNSSIQIAISPEAYNNWGNRLVYKALKPWQTVLSNKSTVVNYKVADPDKQTMKNITTNIMMGTYFRLVGGGYNNKFIKNVMIHPNVMQNFTKYNSTTETNGKILYDDIIQHPKFIFDTGTSNKIPTSSSSYELTLTNVHTGDITTDQFSPLLTVVTVFKSGENEICAVTKDQATGRIQEPDNKQKVQYTEIVGVPGTITHILCVNINFIKVSASFKALDPINNTILLFSYYPPTKDYQSLNYGTKYKMTYDASTKKWSLLEFNYSDGNGNGVFVDSGGTAQIDQTGSLTPIATSNETQNAITPVNNIITDTSQGSVYIQYASTDWGTTGVVVTQVGTSDQINVTS